MKRLPAVFGAISQSKAAVATKDGVYVLDGREVRFLTWREVDAILGLRDAVKPAAPKADA